MRGSKQEKQAYLRGNFLLFNFTKALLRQCGLGEKVAQGLKEKLGIEATLINPRFASGIDEELLEGLKANHQVVITLEDGVLEGGFGEKVARFFGPSLVRTRCYGVKKALYDRYDYQKMLTDNHLTPEQMVADVEELLKQ